MQHITGVDGGRTGIDDAQDQTPKAQKQDNAPPVDETVDSFDRSGLSWQWFSHQLIPVFLNRSERIRMCHANIRCRFA